MSAPDGLTIIAGHSNPDFDAYGSMVAGTRLFPGSVAVFAGTQNANVREFHLLHGEFLDFVDLKRLDRERVTRVVMVDTRDASRLGELAPLANDPAVDLIVYDHHPATSCDVPRGDDRSRPVGATTSILAHELREREISLTPVEASAILLGIHEDTGSLTYPGSTAYDADAVAFLMAQGADMEVVERFLYRSLTLEQRSLLDSLTESLEVWDVHGRDVAVAVASAPGYVDSAGLVTHHLVEDLGHRVAFAVVSMPERVQIVGRSRLREVDVGAVLAHLGGGGHAQAASAALRDVSVSDVLGRLREALDAQVSSPLTAADIASAPVKTVGPSETMDQVAERMELWGHRVLPVLDGDTVIGVVTRADVDKAVRHGLGHAPVMGFITRGVPQVAPNMRLEDLEALMSRGAVGSLPVVEDGRLLGIVTRADVLRAEHGDAYLSGGAKVARSEATAVFTNSFETLLPERFREAVRTVGEIAQDAGVRAFLVGGLVRDMLLRRENLDVDVVVEGDGIEFAQRTAERLGGHVRAHARFGTAVVVLDRGLHMDVTSARTEYYTRPGALPTVERSSLRQDLLRRDFTINAMAVSIDPAEFGAVLDPFNGLADLREGIVRVLHPLSFIEDPTRVMRAARFEKRFGFSMDHPTELLARHAVEMGLLAELSGARMREELLAILAEDDAVAQVRRLGELGALPVIVPRGVAADEVRSDLAGTKASLDEMPRPAGRAPRRTLAMLAALAGRGTPKEVERWAEHLRIGHDASVVVKEVAARAGSIRRSLERATELRDSRLYALLDGLAPESLVYVRALGPERVRERVDRFAGVLSHVRLEVGGDDLVAMGAPPSPAFSDILARVRDRRLDGAVAGREAELAELKRLAVRSGLIQRP